MELKRAKTLVEAAEHSVGTREARDAARIEIRLLLSDYEMYMEREVDEDYRPFYTTWHETST